VDATLEQRFVYVQVFANAGGEHGILDLLTVTRAGRLAIIELKASEHIHLPLQAADYWLRVRRELQSGEIARYGYFPGIALQQAARSSIWWRRRCDSTRQLTISCIACRRKWRLCAWVSPRAGGAACALSCASNCDRREARCDETPRSAFLSRRPQFFLTQQLPHR